MDFLKNAYTVFIQYKELYLQGIKITLLVSLTGTVFGLILGLLLSYARDIELKKGEALVKKILKALLKYLSKAYVEILRGTPMIVQAVFIYYGLYKLLNWTPVEASIIIVSLNTSAYMSEIIRSGVSSIDKGQMEAGLSIGLTNAQGYRMIILPQVLKNSLPSIGNEFVVNIKDTSILNAIALTELFFQGMSVAGTTYDFTTAMFIIGVIYFILTFMVTRILWLIEKKMKLETSAIKSISVSHT